MDEDKSSSIDNNLKRVFQETVEAEVPDRFRTLLDQLRAQETVRAGQMQMRMDEREERAG